MAQNVAFMVGCAKIQCFNTRALSIPYRTNTYRLQKVWGGYREWIAGNKNGFLVLI